MEERGVNVGIPGSGGGGKVGWQPSCKVSAPSLQVSLVFFGAVLPEVFGQQC